MKNNIFQVLNKDGLGLVLNQPGETSRFDHKALHRLAANTQLCNTHDTLH